MKLLDRIKGALWVAWASFVQIGLPIGILALGAGLGAALGVAGGHYEAAMHNDTADLLGLRLIGCGIIGGIAGLMITLRWMCGAPLKDENNA